MTFFHRTRENNPQIYMEPQKTPKQSLKKNKAGVSCSLTSDYTTKLY